MMKHLQSNAKKWFIFRSVKAFYYDIPLLYDLILQKCKIKDKNIERGHRKIAKKLLETNQIGNFMEEFE